MHLNVGEKFHFKDILLNVDSEVSNFINVENRIRKQNIDLRAFKIGEYFNRSMFGEFKMIMSNHQLNITDI